MNKRCAEKSISSECLGSVGIEWAVSNRDVTHRAKYYYVIAIVLLSSVLGRPVNGQNQKGGSPNADPSTFPGESYLIQEWPTTKPEYGSQRIIWYKTVRTTSTSQPIILEPISCNDRPAAPTLFDNQNSDKLKFEDCDRPPRAARPELYAPSLPARDRNPLQDGQRLVIAIYDQAGVLDPSTVLLLNLNVVPQTASALSPAALRPSISSSGGGNSGPGQGTQGILPGVTLSISAKSGTPQTSATLKPFGDLVAVVTDASGNGAPGVNVTFSAQPAQNGASTTLDTQTVQTDSTGAARATFTANSIAGGPYQVIATAQNVTGAAVFTLKNIPPKYYYLTWMNRLTADTALTVSVTALLPAPLITQQNPLQPSPAPSEPAVTILNATYTQVHALDTYNVAFGMIYSSLRNPTFTRVESQLPVTCPSGSSPTCVASPSMYQTVRTPGARPIDPTVFFTVYVFGKFDAERKWHWTDLKPEPSVGLSLSSPGSDFFVGASSEVLRGIQIVGGWHRGKINALGPSIVNDPTSSAAPATVQNYGNGGFVGVSFNINFIQSLFGGGKGSQSQ
jgi:hypothetical protein